MKFWQLVEPLPPPVPGWPGPLGLGVAAATPAIPNTGIAVIKPATTILRMALISHPFCESEGVSLLEA